MSMMPTATTTGSGVADKILSVLNDNKGMFQLEDIWLGDQQLFPRTPCATVVAGNTDIDLAGAPRRVQDTYNVTINLYHCKITDNQDVERECNRRAEEVRHFLDDYDSGRLDGLVISSMVIRMEPGYANRGLGAQANWYKTSRLIWQGISRYNLAYSP